MAGSDDLAGAIRRRLANGEPEIPVVMSDHQIRAIAQMLRPIAPPASAAERRLLRSNN
jgi:hypothetical protein